MNNKTIEQPAVPAIPLSEAKIQLRVDHTDEDGEIARKVNEAVVECEKIAGLAFITRTLAGYLDEFPSTNSGEILLPRPPASEIVSIKYYDADDVQQTLDPAEYEFDGLSTPGRLRPASGSSWPATRPRYSAVEIQWKTGYGDDPTDIPDNLRAAAKLALADLYENRESIVLGLNANTTDAIGQLLALDRLGEGVNQ